MMASLFASYTAVSKKLGLAFEDGRIHGVVDGVALQMWFGTHAVHVGALLLKPAPIDLSVVTKGLIGKLGSLFGGHSDQLGDPEFDKVFSVKASNVSQVAALFDPIARKALLEVAEAGYHPALDAHTLHLRRFSASAAADSEVDVERDFREAARLARILGESFARAYR